MVKSLRLQKYMADCGICSRRKAEEYIQAGQVKVNGKVATIGMKVSDQDAVTINEKLVEASSSTKETYLVYKPLGYTSTTKDPFADHVVTELVPHSTARLYPVGRLDKNSEGLIILTNDGNLAHEATHPSFMLSKIYEVHITPDFREEDRAILEKGIEDNDEKLTLDSLSVIGPRILRITLHHGKKRHIRRMLANCHYHVNRLIRTTIGPFSFATLSGRPYCLLTQEQIKLLAGHTIRKQKVKSKK